MDENHCRACCEELNHFREPLFNREDGDDIREKLQFVTGLKIESYDQFSKTLCVRCFDDTITAYDLKTRCLESDKLLINDLAESDFEDVIIKTEMVFYDEQVQNESFSDNQKDAESSKMLAMKKKPLSSTCTSTSGPNFMPTRKRNSNNEISQPEVVSKRYKVIDETDANETFSTQIDDDNNYVAHSSSSKTTHGAGRRQTRSLGKDETTNRSSTSVNLEPMSNQLPPNNVVIKSLRNEMHENLKRIVGGIRAANAKAEARFEKLANKFKRSQEEIANLRSKMRERHNNFDYQEQPKHEKIGNPQQFAEMEKRLSSENEELHRQLTSMIVPCLNPKMGYSKSENSLTASLLAVYFEESFLNELGWADRSERISLSHNPGHMRLFTTILQKSYPGKFLKAPEINSSFSKVMKRFREKNVRRFKRHSKTNQPASHQQGNLPHSSKVRKALSPETSEENCSSDSSDGEE